MSWKDAPVVSGDVPAKPAPEQPATLKPAPRREVPTGDTWQDAPQVSGTAKSPSGAPRVGPLSSFSYGVGQGASANFLDEMQALGAGTPDTPEYDAELARQRAIIHAAEEQYPTWYGIGNAIGAIPATFLPVGFAARGSGVIGKTVAGAGSGAAQGAIWGAGAGEGMDDRAKRARETAMVTGGIGAAIPLVGGVGGMISRYMGRSKSAPAPGVNPGDREALSKEFGVPLTSGQKTGNISQQASEEAMAHDARGAIPTRIMKGFREKQIEANREAASKIGQSTAKSIRVDTAADAGDLAIAGVKGRANQLRAQSQAAYDVAEKAGLTLRDDAVRDASKNIELRLINKDVSIVPSLHPSAMEAIREVEQLASMKTRGRGAQVNPASLEAIERARRGILKMKGVNDDDRRVLGEVKEAFDGWLDDAVDNSLFSGDPAALDALKDARKLWRDYKNITAGKGPDEANRKIASFFEKDVTGQEVANWITGSAALGGSGTSYRTAKKLRDILGADSDEWGAVRQGVWASLTQSADAAGGPSPQKMASTLFEFLEGKGKPLATTLYTAEERAKMLRYANLQKAMVPDPKATNPSKTSYGVMRQATAPAWAAVASSLGFTGGEIAGTPGGIAGIALATSIPIFRQGRAIAAAKSAVSGKTKPSSAVGKGLDVLNRAATPAAVERFEDSQQRAIP